MNKLVPTLLCLAAMALAYPSPGADQTGLDSVSRENLRQRLISTPFRLSKSMNGFSKKIYDILSQSDNGNILYSPFSLHTALSMTFYGSPQDSRTNAELGNVLGMERQYQEDYPTNYLQLLTRYDNLRKAHSTKVRFANKIYTAENFRAKDDFLSLLRIFFRTTQERVNFGDTDRALRDINGFVSSKTNGLIPELLGPEHINSLTRMVLINAIYFKADWKTKFDQVKTRNSNFKIEQNNNINVRSMNVREEFGVADFDGFRVLEMPYQDSDIRMLVILPDEDSDILTVGQQFRSIDFSNLDQRLDYGKRRVRLPKFQFSFKREMAKALEQLGVHDLFDEERADLSDMSDEPNIAVTSVIHEAKIEVDEEGSEAAAATAVNIGTRTIMNGKAPDFIVDRPFMFVIHDKAFNVPLFVGRVVDPSGSGWELSGAHSKREILAPKDGGFQNLPQIQSQVQGELHQQQGPVNLPNIPSRVTAPPEDLIDEVFDESPGSVPDHHQSAGTLQESDAASPVGGGNVFEQEQIDPQVPTAGDDDNLPRCPTLLGFLLVDSPNVSFPCKGHDTLQLQAHRRRQRLIDHIRRARCQNC